MDPALGMVIVPGLDMANHNDEVQVTVRSGPTRKGESFSIQLPIDTKVDSGTQVFTTYGRKSNAQLLFSFGFSRSDRNHAFNSADIELKVPSAEEDSWREEKILVLQSMNIAPRMRFQIPAAKYLLSEGLSCGFGVDYKTRVAQLDPEASKLQEDLLMSWSYFLPYLRLMTVHGDAAKEMLTPLKVVQYHISQSEKPDCYAASSQTILHSLGSVIIWPQKS